MGKRALVALVDAKLIIAEWNTRVEQPFYHHYFDRDEHDVVNTSDSKTRDQGISSLSEAAEILAEANTLVEQHVYHHDFDRDDHDVEHTIDMLPR